MSLNVAMYVVSGNGNFLSSRNPMNEPNQADRRVQDPGHEPAQINRTKSDSLTDLPQLHRSHRNCSFLGPRTFMRAFSLNFCFCS